MARIAWLRAEIARLSALSQVYRKRALLTGTPGSIGFMRDNYIRMAERTEDLIVRYKTELSQLITIHPTVPVPGTEYIQPVLGPSTSDQPPAPASVTPMMMVEAQAAAATAPASATVPAAAAAEPFYKQTWFMVAGAAVVGYLLLTRRA